MGKHLAIVVIVMLIVGSTLPSMGLTADIFQATVPIQNDLGDGIHLKTRCRSGDDDLGEKDLSNGEFTEWLFHPNILMRNTLFWCKMKWNNVEGSFDVYSYTRDASRCLQCPWSIRKDGAYSYSTANKTWEWLYAWTN